VKVFSVPHKLLLQLVSLPDWQGMGLEKFQLIFCQGLTSQGADQEGQDGSGDVFAGRGDGIFQVEEKNVGLGLGRLDHEVPIVSREDVLDRSGSVIPSELLDGRVSGRIGFDPLQRLPPFGYCGFGLRLVTSKGRHHLTEGSFIHTTPSSD
jgi:hypothetical protein